MTTITASTEPQRARAVFASEDFALIRNAVSHYLGVVKDDPESMKYARLYHRLGRLIPQDAR